MILLQNKIIYMPGVPLFARNEKIADYAKACMPVRWREQRIMTDDSTEIALGIGEISNDQWSQEAQDSVDRQLVIVYFQGCATVYLLRGRNILADACQEMLPRCHRVSLASPTF